jgi:uroporphyrin-III C-methyltransferase
MTGKVVFVGAGPGDPDLITVRGLRALQEADVVLHDSLVSQSLLVGLKGQLISVGKRGGRHSMAQEEINGLLLRHAREGRAVVRLKGGDGAVFGRLGEELLFLAARDVPLEVVPGVTSATAAPIFAGIPVTHRGLADSFLVVTAHHRENEPVASIPPYNPATTVILMMALGTTGAWRAQLLAQGYPPDLPVAYISAGGTRRQRVLVTTIGAAAEQAAAAELAGPVLAVVGRVVSLRDQLAWYDPGASAAKGDYGCLE